MLGYIKTLRDQGSDLFGKRKTLMSLWQELAEQFYVERADFTSCRYIGEELASNLTTSYPLIARRDLGNVISSMLRPRNQKWFDVSVLYQEEQEKLDVESRRWLERATKIQRRAIYDKNAKFVQATKEGDHDYVTFGQCVISVEMNHKKNALLYRNWHLRDVVWLEDYDRSICQVFRRSKVPVHRLDREFKGNISAKAQKAHKKDPTTPLEYYHVVMPAVGS